MSSQIFIQTPDGEAPLEVSQSTIEDLRRAIAATLHVRIAAGDPLRLVFDTRTADTAAAVAAVESAKADAATAEVAVATARVEAARKVMAVESAKVVAAEKAAAVAKAVESLARAKAAAAAAGLEEGKTGSTMEHAGADTDGERRRLLLRPRRPPSPAERARLLAFLREHMNEELASREVRAPNGKYVPFTTPVHDQTFGRLKAVAVRNHWWFHTRDHWEEMPSSEDASSHGPWFPALGDRGNTMQKELGIAAGELLAIFCFDMSHDERSAAVDAVRTRFRRAFRLSEHDTATSSTHAVFDRMVVSMRTLSQTLQENGWIALGHEIPVIHETSQCRRGRTIFVWTYVDLVVGRFVDGHPQFGILEHKMRKSHMRDISNEGQPYILQAVFGERLFRSTFGIADAVTVEPLISVNTLQVDSPKLYALEATDPRCSAVTTFRAALEKAFAK